jgi:RND family efflux transporter MFP subunit
VKYLVAPVAFFRRHWKLCLVIVVLVGGFLFFKSKSAQAKKVPLSFAHPQKQDLTKKLEVSGVIDAKEKASLRFASGGKVTYIGAKEGDVIKKWQTIARIDAADLQKRMQQDLNLYFNQRMDFDQSKANLKDKAITTTDERTQQKDQKTLENEVLDVQIRDIAIKNTVLSSPIEGVLVSSPTNVTGVNLFSTDVFEVVNPASLVFRAAVDETDIALVKKDQPAAILLDSYPEDKDKVETKIEYISYKSSQTSTGTVFIVEMPIPQNYQFSLLDHFRLGMNGDVTIVLAEKKNVLAVPLSATKERDGKTYVTLYKGKENGKDKTEDKEIEKGLETDDAVEVVSGLTEQDQIVVP